MEQRRQCVNMSGDGSSMWTLGKCIRENALKLVVQEFEGQVLIYFQHYFKSLGEDHWYLMKKEWRWLWRSGMSCININAKVMHLHHKNEQLDPLPPKGIKRNLQSAFGGEDEWVCGMFVLWMLRIVKSCIIYAIFDQVRFCINFALDFVDEVASP